jgi:ADP-ribose pyrophosphatase
LSEASAARRQADAAALVNDAADVRILERRLAYGGFFDLEVLRLQHRRFDGSMSGVVSREVLHIPNASAALPYDPVADRVVLIEQFRAGTLGHPEGPWLLETVAGLMEPGEDAATTARREILEEAGLKARRLERIGAYIASPGAVTEHTTVFIADVDSRSAGGVHGLDSETEDIKSHIIERAAAIDWLENGRIVAANAVFALRWLQVHGAALRARWLAAPIQRA